MKNTSFIFTILFGFMISPSLSAQDFSITERKMSFGSEAYESLVVNITNPDEAKASVEKYAKDKLGLKLKKDGRDVLMADKISLPTIIPSKRGDLLVAFTDAQMSFAFRMGYDFILNGQEYEDEMYRFKQLVNDVLFHYYSDGLNAQIEKKERQIKDFEKEISKNTRESEKLGRDIQKNNKKIGKADESDRIGMENESIDAQNRQAAIADINANLQNEIRKLTDEINTIRQSINTLSQKASDNITPKK